MKKVIIGVSVAVAIVVAILISYGHSMASNADYYRDRCYESDRQVARLEEALRRAKHDYHISLVEEMVKSATAMERLLVANERLSSIKERVKQAVAAELPLKSIEDFILHSGAGSGGRDNNGNPVR